MENLRKYGNAPYTIAVIHGGPGALGEMTPVAKEPSSITGILEPLQTCPSIEGQLRELHTSLKKHHLPITLIGHSWGAWLSFIYTAYYPMSVKKLILVGSAPFEEKYAAHIMETRLNRLSEKDQLEAHYLQKAISNPVTDQADDLLLQFGKLMSKADSYDPMLSESKIPVDWGIFKKVWPEASDLRRTSQLLELGKRIKCPVVAIHGDYDPHPYEGVEKPLSQIIKDFKLILLKNCGHTPWLERQVKQNFYRILKESIRVNE